MARRALVPLVLLAGLAAPAPDAEAARMAGLDRVWQASRGGGALVAVLDSGVDATRPDLAGALWRNPRERPNGLDDDDNGVIDDVHGADLVDGDGDPRDEHGHGTAEASIVAGRGVLAPAGVAPSATVLPVRVLDAHNRGTTGQAAEGVRYAVRAGARILLMALNSDAADPDLEAAVREAEAAGAVVVATAGNDGRDLDARPSYPAASSSPAVLAVGASGHDGARAPFSNFGLHSVDVYAPGVDVPGAALAGDEVRLDGTSPAAATVAGALAVLAGARPDLPAPALRTALVEAARAARGRLDLTGALARVAGPPPAAARAKAVRLRPAAARARRPVARTRCVRRALVVRGSRRVRVSRRLRVARCLVARVRAARR